MTTTFADLTECGLLAVADLLLGLRDCLLPPSADQVTGIAQFAEATPNLLAAMRLTLTGPYQALGQAATSADLPSTQAEYTRLFVAGSLCPPYECTFIRRDKGAIIGDIAGFYRAFGWQTDDQEGSRPDHIACELEFCAMVMVSLAKASGDKQSDNWKITMKALKSFMADHGNDWIPAFAAKLLLETSSDYYRLVAQCLGEAWVALAALQELPCTFLEELPVLEPDTPCECPQQLA